MLKTPFFWLLSVLLVLPCACTSQSSSIQSSAPLPSQVPLATVKLPEPRLKSPTSLEEALSKRRSVRSFTGAPLKLEEVSQLLWAAQGTTSATGGRTAPSAGGLYPLEVYLVAGNVDGLGAGVYKYKPQTHELMMLGNRDIRQALAEAALNQSSVKDGAIDIVIAGVYERTTVKYGNRGVRFVHLEAGQAAQNVCLQATALDLGTVTVGAFSDDKVKSVLAMPQEETPLYIMPVGRK